MKRAFDEPRHPDGDVVAWYGGPAYEPDPEPPPPPTPPDELHKTGARAGDGPKDPAALAKVGVIVGRFLPVHVGHMHLIERAFSQCGMLYVLSPDRVARLAQSAPLTLGIPDAGRASFFDALGLHKLLLEAACRDLAKVEILLSSSADPSIPRDPADPAFAARWAELVREKVPHATTLFSSDDGGGADALAQALGVEHVCVDPRRSAFPISGTEIRADLYGRFRQVARAARPMLALQVVVVGAEGAGKSTLVRELQAIFEASVVEDGLRVESELAGGGIPAADAFTRSIASIDARRAEAARASVSGVVVSDEAALLTRAWVARLRLDVPVHRLRYAEREEADLWLVCHNDFPFQGAPERDEPHARAALLRDLVDEIMRDAARKTRVVHVRGEGRDRVDVAADAIRAALEEKRALVTAALS